MKLHSLSALIATLALVASANAQTPTGTTQIETSRIQPLIEPGAMGSARSAGFELAADALKAIANTITDYRLQRDWDKKLAAVVPKAREIMLNSGAPAVLIEMKFERPANADLYSDIMPPNTMLRFSPGSPSIIGSGLSATEIVAFSEDRMNFRAGPTRGFEFVKEPSRYVLVSRAGDKKGELYLQVLSFEKVNRDARIMLTDGERLKAAKTYTENFSIDLALSRLELSSKSAEVRMEANKLLKQRDQAAEQVATVNDGLYKDLKRARAAARDAATFSLIADGLSIVGAGVGAGGSSSSGTGGQGSAGAKPSAPAQNPQGKSKNYEIDVLFKKNGIIMEHYNLQQNYQLPPKQ